MSKDTVKKKKKLPLNKSTLRKLVPDQLDGVAGGKDVTGSAHCRPTRIGHGQGEA